MTRFVSPSLPAMTDRWVMADWETYAMLTQNPIYQKGRCYYDAGRMRIEMSPLGPFHARENSVISNVVTLFATFKSIRMVELTNGTLRKPGVRDGQPDLSFYLGDEFALPPQTDQPLNIEIYGVPQLAIEIASTSLSDDLGAKRLLYERMGVQEYWVVNIADCQVIAFAIAEGQSGEIRTSQVLPGLDLAVVEAALNRSQREDDATINRWLITQFQP